MLRHYGLTLAMRPWNEIICRLMEETNGVTAIEYGLIAALIAVAAVVVIGTVGTNLSSTFNSVAGSL
jgi:pilus assembly protein Flp/PilA